jgi:4Fe-4S ferredoxin
MAREAPDCKGVGLLVPVIDRNRCEGKEACVEVCPYGVFAMGRLREAERAQLSARGRIKAFFHGYRQAFVAKPADCHACGLCVKACPERAITLERANPQ